jgi:hypothetical protein
MRLPAQGAAPEEGDMGTALVWDAPGRFRRLTRRLGIAAAFAVLAAAGPAQSADKTTVVNFARGKTSATVVDQVKGYDTGSFVLKAAAGQTLAITFTPNNRSCYYNVTGPSGGEAIFNGSVSGDDFSGTLAQSGDHQVMVYLMRNEARRGKTCRFTITFRIEG